MIIKFTITFSGECDFETLKKEFNLPKTVSFEEAGLQITTMFLSSKQPDDKIENLTCETKLEKL